MNFIENLDRLIKNTGISKNKLAKEIEISEGTIRSWYSGKQPALDKVVKISEYFTITINELVGTNLEYQELIEAYKKADIGTRTAVDKLLDIKDQGKLSTSEKDKIG